jgi:KDO2-lipid IV(A) lauroyltransferase
VLHWLPLPVIAMFGRGLGRLLYRFGHARRRIVLTNLGLCFPAMSEAEKSAMARRHFEAIGRSLLERGLAWWASESRMRKLVRIEHLDRLRALEGRPVILLVPHFVGLDLCGTRITMEANIVSVYARQKNPVVDRMLYRGRTRFGDQLILSRQEGMRLVVRALKEGRPLYYLPDMDYGPRDAIFVPFFGVPAATIPALSRLVRLTGAAVLPCVARMPPDGSGYVFDIREAWTGFPGASIEDDTRRMNAFIEDCVREMPEQYYWVHKRFKTRPPGEKGFYDR